MEMIDRKAALAAEEWVNRTNLEVDKSTPLDEGDLRASRYVTKLKTSGSFIIETGFKAVYAVSVHEWPSTVNWTTSGTGNKFLQRPYYSNARSLADFITSRVKI